MNSKLLGTPIERFTRMMFTNIIHRLAQFLSEEDFSISQIAALHLLGSREALSVQELATELKRSISATSRLADGLVERGLLLRREDPEDRRAKLLSLAASGRELLDAMSVERVQIIQETLAKLPEGIPKAMLAAIKKVF